MICYQQIPWGPIDIYMKAVLSFLSWINNRPITLQEVSCVPYREYEEKKIEKK